jgi:hypothetical protein
MVTTMVVLCSDDDDDDDDDQDLNGINVELLTARKTRDDDTLKNDFENLQHGNAAFAAAQHANKSTQQTQLICPKSVWSMRSTLSMFNNMNSPKYLFQVIDKVPFCCSNSCNNNNSQSFRFAIR